MMREFGCQMEKTGLYIDQSKDKIIYPKKYFSSAMWNKQREATTLYIQCRIRAWFARRTANALRKKQDDRDNELLTKQADLRDKEEQETEHGGRTKANDDHGAARPKRTSQRGPTAASTAERSQKARKTRKAQPIANRVLR